MKKTNLFFAILNTSCAALWMARVITAVLGKEYEESQFSFIMNLLMALTWVATAAASMLKYLCSKDEEC